MISREIWPRTLVNHSQEIRYFMYLKHSSHCFCFMLYLISVLCWMYIINKSNLSWYVIIFMILTGDPCSDSVQVVLLLFLWYCTFVNSLHYLVCSSELYFSDFNTTRQSIWFLGMNSECTIPWNSKRQINIVIIFSFDIYTFLMMTCLPNFLSFWTWWISE